MLGVKDTVLNAYSKVEEFFKRIVPKNGTLLVIGLLNRICVKNRERYSYPCSLFVNGYRWSLFDKFANISWKECFIRGNIDFADSLGLPPRYPQQTAWEKVGLLLAMFFYHYFLFEAA